MQQYNIHEAKTSKPIVKKQRIGFLKGKISVPADFDSMGKDEIEKLFEGTLWRQNSSSGKSNFANL